MSTCAFCGTQRRFGQHFLAHRLSTSRLHTVKVCEGCLADARQSGYQIAERESGWSHDAGLLQPLAEVSGRPTAPTTHLSSTCSTRSERRLLRPNLRTGYSQ